MKVKTITLRYTSPTGIQVRRFQSAASALEFAVGLAAQGIMAKWSSR